MFGLNNQQDRSKIREQQGSMPKDVPYGAEIHSGSFKKNAKTPQSVKLHAEALSQS
jgi:hypothetical protein